MVVGVFVDAFVMAIVETELFAIDGPTAWNSLSDDLRDPTLSTDSFRRLLKTHLFSEY